MNVIDKAKETPMRKAYMKIIQTLKKVAKMLRTGDTPDCRRLEEASATLERAIHDMPETSPELIRLLRLCGQALQIIAQNDISGPEGIYSALNGALAAAIQCLSFGVNSDRALLVSEASETLYQSITHSLTKPETSSMSNSSFEPPVASSSDSLDDIAAFLVRLEPTDLSGLTDMQMRLNQAAAGAPVGSLTGRLAVEASLLIDELIRGHAQDPTGILAEVGRLIEQALLAAAIPDLAPALGAPAVPESVLSTPDSNSVTSKTVMPRDESDHFAKEMDSPILTPPTLTSDSKTDPTRLMTSRASTDRLPPDSDLALLGDFITESRECLEGAETALLMLETDPNNVEAVNMVFRAFHTIKGTSAFLGLARVTDLAHQAESLLSRVRDREIRYTGGYANLALQSTDMLKALLQIVQDAMGGAPMVLPEGYDALLDMLHKPEAAGISDEPDSVVGEVPRLGDLLVATSRVTREDVEAVVADKGDQPIGLALLKSQSAGVADVANALRVQQRMQGSERSGDSSVRVRTDRLDRLIDMVGELVIAHSMIAQDPTVRNSVHHELSHKVTRAGKITRELQDLTMSMRMVPLKASFQKMARLTRDLAQKSGKLVDFVTEGEDTEIDRNMVDIIGDPLVHMVRNALDHGIERPDDRAAQGKPRAGRLHLRAYHAGGNVVVELHDDGKGLDRARIIKKALEKGLLDSDKGLSDGEVFNLIYAPGFSTADEVTDISGRGVGMDVVKRNVQALRGQIDIASESGKGSRFSLRLPLTLAITDGMLVKVGVERYIVPTVNISLSFRPTAGALSTIAGRGEMVMLRDDLMPMFRLHRLFHVDGAVEDPTQGLLVVVGDGDGRCALLVDELLGQQQVVAKSLGDGIGKVLGITGGAILGDGRVGLILDAAEIVRLVRQAPSGRSGVVVPRSSAA
ncbi:MAG: chemotaxis protein CheA [Acidobacteria bacterium]|nr:chemotaxis protein CheA [Acidobacteriota bacterium]